MDLTEVGYKALDWIQLDQDVIQWLVLVNIIMNFRAQ